MKSFNNSALSRKSLLYAFFAILVNLLFILNSSPAQAQTDYLVSFSDPAHLWGNGIERVIEEAYRQFFITRVVGDRIMNIRMPFAMNDERDLLLGTSWEIYGGGKGSPQMLWPVIEELLDSQDFEDYINALSSGREKIFIFDINERKWSTSSDLFLIARIKAGSFTGFSHRPYALTSGKGALQSDVYNYLYCIGHIGIDCSGFVWHILDYIGKRGGIDLGRIISPVLGAPRGADPAWYAGTSFFSSRNSQIIQITDEIRNLRPADVMLFRDIDGIIVHSAIIQSIDFTKGVIRYLQCNSVAALEERGVHDSYIYFDPANTSVSLKDPSLHWSKKRYSAFIGEEINFADDGERYRHRLNGGGRVVRMRALVPVIDRLNR